MHIIALQGRGCSGKTTTLKQLIETIKNTPGFETEDIVEGYDSRYWGSYNGIKIGITTRGDAEEYLYDDFFGNQSNFVDRDIVVCAIRTRGETLNFVKKCGGNDLVIHGRWYFEGSKNIDERRANTCAIQAQAIFMDIVNFIEEMEDSR